MLFPGDFVMSLKASDIDENKIANSIKSAISYYLKVQSVEDLCKIVSIRVGGETVKIPRIFGLSQFGGEWKKLVEGMDFAFDVNFASNTIRFYNECIIEEYFFIGFWAQNGYLLRELYYFSSEMPSKAEVAETLKKIKEIILRNASVLCDL